HGREEEKRSQRETGWRWKSSTPKNVAYHKTMQCCDEDKSPCYHLTLFVYREHASDPHTYLSICSNITNTGTNTLTKETKDIPALTVGPHTYMTKVAIVGPELEADDWFKITTGISGHSNNWLLLVEQAAQDANDDCVVCLGPRPTLRIVPAPVEDHCLIAVMNWTNIPEPNCTKWDRTFPITGQEKKKPIFNNKVTSANHTCINMTGSGERIGRLNSSNCLTITKVNETFKPISRADVWWWCGDPQIYDRMPSDWTGVCGLVSLLLPIQVVKLSVTDITITSQHYWQKRRTKRAAPEEPGPDPTYIDAIGVPRGVPDEYKLVDQVAAGFESSLCWWCTINKNVDRINYIHYNVQRLGNLTQAGLYAVAEQLRATSLMSFQNRIALDMLLSENNGVCSMFGEQCCTYIPNNTAADGSLTRALEGLKTLNEKMKEHSGVDTSMWDSWMDMFGKYRSLVSSILVSIAVFAAILTLCGCCCIPCIRSMINRLIATAITPDPVGQKEIMTLLEHADTDSNTDDEDEETTCK
uniref:Envelope glycoprotein n=1 Tax=Oreochromis aureus TaxID=47969 RepID=A0A668TU23_OREAU